MSFQNIFIKFFCRQEHFPIFTLGNQWRACKAEGKTDATATGSAARVASDANFSGRNVCVTCDPCGTVRYENATLTPRKGETTNDQNRTTRIRIVALWFPLSAGQAERLDSHRQRRLEPNAFIWGQKPRAKALPTSFLLRKKGSKENFHAKEKHKTNSKTR